VNTGLGITSRGPALFHLSWSMYPRAGVSLNLIRVDHAVAKRNPILGLKGRNSHSSTLCIIRASHEYVTKICLGVAICYNNSSSVFCE